MKITVFMPAYNSELYIEQAIASILNQTYKNFEFLIINDGSTDQTEAKILSFKDKRIKYIRNDSNAGVAAVGNQAFDIINSEYIARMDADDIAFPERITKQLDFLEKNTEYGLLGTWYQRINKNGLFLDVIEKEVEDEDIRLHMLMHSQFCQPTVMIRTSIAKEIKYNESLKICEDYDLWENMMQVTKVANIPQYLLQYRWHGTNTSIVQQPHLKEAVLYIISRQLDRLEIEYTPEELFIHATLTFHYAHGYFYTIDRLEALNSWFSKLGSSKELVSRFGEGKLRKFIHETWQKIGLFNDNRPTYMGIPNANQSFSIMENETNIIKGLWVGEELNIINTLSIRSYLRLGYQFHLYTYGKLKNAPAGTLLRDANEIIPEEYVFHDNSNSVGPFSDLFRYYLLYKLGGWWVDLDTICLKRLDDLTEEYVFPSEFHPNFKVSVTGFIMKAPKQCDLLLDCLRFLSQRKLKNIQNTEIAANLLGRMIYKNNLQKFVRPPHFFCPIPYYSHEMIVNDVLLDLNAKSYILHCFTELLRRKKVQDQKSFSEFSLLGRLQEIITTEYNSKYALDI